MKEGYIKNKVVELAGRFTGNAAIARMNRERQMAAIRNKIDQELTRSLDGVTKHMNAYIHQVLKEEIK